LSEDSDHEGAVAGFDLRLARELTRKARSLRDTGEIEQSIAGGRRGEERWAAWRGRVLGEGGAGWVGAGRVRA
jgi:hypothetical protein